MTYIIDKPALRIGAHNFIRDRINRLEEAIAEKASKQLTEFHAGCFNHSIILSSEYLPPSQIAVYQAKVEQMLKSSLLGAGK